MSGSERRPWEPPADPGPIPPEQPTVPSGMTPAQRAPYILGIGLAVLGFLMYADSYSQYHFCNSETGMLAQAMNDQVALNCQDTSQTHWLALGLLAVGILVLIVQTLKDKAARAQGRQPGA